ncbi:phage head closure protein [Aliihoeflea aestuarii]|jgi:SPP1 family predicted phage head-tail adaptor|uniref:phage head closure protein n=1 Tax=Aliihoeflea aestuarii TaxID=453840 RepID=UPI002092B28C|nr:phage head closure protein [Aliihoeflea aestuarii]MCO6390558.1 phage head closure protein [Aliihoeflea aestuarii]
MRAGELDRTIVIESYVRGEPDEWGIPHEGWEPFATVRVKIMQSSTEEFLRSYGETAEAAIIFRIRWIDDLTTMRRVTYEGVQFNIREIKEIGRRKGLDIRCVGRAS